MRNAPLPRVLSDSLGSERKDFAVEAGRAKPLIQSLGVIFFGTFWTGFTCVFIGIVLGPLFVGKETQFELNGVPTVAGPGNLESIIVPAIFLGVFLIIGILLLVWGFYSMFRRGGVFCGHSIAINTIPEGKDEIH